MKTTIAHMQFTISLHHSSSPPFYLITTIRVEEGTKRIIQTHQGISKIMRYNQVRTYIQDFHILSSVLFAVDLSLGNNAPLVFSCICAAHGRYHRPLELLDLIQGLVLCIVRNDLFKGRELVLIKGAIIKDTVMLTNFRLPCVIFQ